MNDQLLPLHAMFVRLIGLPVLLLAHCISVWSQPRSVEIVGAEQGLSQVFVPCILQDREGFLWAGSKNGLNRYDGRSFKVFKAMPEDPWSLSSSLIWSLCEAGDFILVGNNSGVLDFFNRQTQQALHLPLERAGVGNAHYVQDIFLDAANRLYLLAGSHARKKLYSAALPLDFWNNLPEQPDLLKQLTFKEVHETFVFSTVVSANRQALFFDADNGLFSLNLQNGQKTKCLEDVTHHSRPHAFRSRLHADAQGGVWVIWENSLQYFDGYHFFRFPVEISISTFLGITSGNKMMLWHQDRLSFVPLESVKSTGRLTTSLVEYDLPNAVRPLCKYEDRSGILWLGADGQGVFKIGGTDSGRIQHFFKGTSVYGIVFSEIDSSVVYLGPDGLRVFPQNGDGPVLRLARQPNATAHGLWRLADGPDGARWLFALMKPNRPVLFKISPDGRTESFSIPLQQVAYNPGNIAYDPYQRALWLALPGVLLRFDSDKKAWQTFSFADLMPHQMEVFAVQPMSDGRVWIGTTLGLIETTQDGKGGFTFKKHQNEKGNPNSLRHNSVSSILPDAADSNVLWLGTKGGGISCLDTRTGQFTHRHTRTGLPDDVIYGLLWSGSADTPGSRYLWASSNKGIIRLHSETGEIRNFTVANGLQSNEFNTWAYNKASNGDLMFGGINGLNVFSPHDFSDNPYAPSIFITGVKINNSAVFPGDSTGILPLAPEFSKRITLHFEQRNLTLEFAALEYSVPSKNRFRWILEGAENTWHPETEQNSATYLNLSPGHYTFKVMAANADGVWNPRPAALEVVILPPWWRSWWAYLLYTAVLAIAARVFYRFQTKRRREQAEAHMLREMDAFKSRFFTNISHEFRTPLTVVLGIAARLSEEKESIPPGDLAKNLNLIQRNAENLLRLVNQILDLAKLESNTLKINYMNGDVAAYLHYLTESFQSLANAQNILLRSDCHPSVIMMDYDPDRISQIIHNLLSNAIKFTPSGGRISLLASVAPDASAPEEKVLRIAVSDTGPGIREEDKPFLFDRFFQADNQSFAKTGGTGIGLSMTRELVRVMGGSIHVESQEGRGATFVVMLPIRQQVPLVPSSDAGKALQPTPVAGIDLSHRPEISGTHLPSLLIIEDNPDVVEYLIACLESDYRLEFAYNGQIGIQKALEIIPDIVISDVVMPRKDGFEVCDFLKNDERTSHIPLVLLTAKATVEDRVAGLSRGADAYMAKPFHRSELLATLGSLLRMRQKLQQRYTAMPQNLPPTQDVGVQMEDAFLARIRMAVEEHLSDSSFSGEALCRHLGMSYPVVYRKLSALTGRSLNIHIRLIRLQHAQQLLRSTSRSVSEIAYDVGFNDPKFFSRVFSEEFGMTPSAFRENKN